MTVVLSLVYGLHIALVIYLVSYFAAKGIVGAGSASSVLIVLKYIIYWQMITFGFKHLPASGILIGLVGSLYLSLPILWWVNKKMVQKQDEGEKEGIEFKAKAG